MNSAHSPRSRLVCRIVRRWRSLSPGTASSHVTACADCQRFFAAGAALEPMLRRDAQRMLESTPAPSEGFERRLLDAIRDSAATAALPSAPARRRNGTWALGGVTVAAAALAVIIGFRGREESSVDPVNQPHPQHAIAATEDAAVLAGAVESLSNGLVEKVVPSAGAMIADNPLQQEFGSVYADVRSAVDFLALNFLPASPPASDRPATRTL